MVRKVTFVRMFSLSLADSSRTRGLSSVAVAKAEKLNALDIASAVTLSLVFFRETS